MLRRDGEVFFFGTAMGYSFGDRRGPAVLSQKHRWRQPAWRSRRDRRVSFVLAGGVSPERQRGQLRFPWSPRDRLSRPGRAETRAAPATTPAPPLRRCRLRRRGSGSNTGASASMSISPCFVVGGAVEQRKLLVELAGNGFERDDAVLRELGRESRLQPDQPAILPVERHRPRSDDREPRGRTAGRGARAPPPSPRSAGGTAPNRAARG